jgi:hypothetical protein
MIRAPQIKSITELLVECNLCDTQRKAANAVKRGDVSVGRGHNRVVVANVDALLVIVERVTLCHNMLCYDIEPWPEGGRTYIAHDHHHDHRNKSDDQAPLEGTLRV